MMFVTSCAGSGAATSEGGAEPTPLSESEVNLANMETLLANLGVGDVEATRDCILDIADVEGLTPSDLMAGTGAPVFIGALRCDDVIADAMVESSAAFDTTGTDLTVDDVECVQILSLELFAAMPLADTEDLFAADERPNDFIDFLMGGCDVDRDEALLIMG